MKSLDYEKPLLQQTEVGVSGVCSCILLPSGIPGMYVYTVCGTGIRLCTE